MKRAVNLRLDENVIFTLNQLSKDLNTTKTEIVEKALDLFSKNNQEQHNNLLKFAGKLKNKDADKMIEDIKNDKDSKNFELNLS